MEISSAVGRDCFVCGVEIKGGDNFLHVVQGLDDAPAHASCWSRYKREYAARQGVQITEEA